ncbi:hypothetical protein TTHERM_00145420 (macronuclear) [Tetrahymena thermophila SB210]|uniref:Uncharacterized protein n=1 Tax=Tetrahymena thermophila (strain SB210) TaxID=312017 RepID=I7LUA9_TETTS|nr:hypothetical protein TTHERM_00145420 [Tetrahymena thermophila SB210]EAR90937.1 hypothetical protein TTHERM_00145420 [Tetrahymena thermophila SB210]|eukprot:XP_001011182.1 hypothetical protein TTHERM_00145420 [Tetrahymena thermophila SB210]
MNQESGQQEYKEIEKVVGQLFTLLNENQKNLAQEALKSQENNPTFIKGKSLVNLICHDFCLYKYPFSQKYSFDYESWVNTFLESERYEWIIQPILIKIKDQWNITYEDDDIKALYILCGAFTNETNNKNRQKKIIELRKILYYIFELNSICTMFTRPDFQINGYYKQTLNDIQQKIKNKLSFALDIDCEDMKYVQQQGINYKLKKSVFKSWVKFLGDVDIVSIGETSKQNSNGLLSYEILNLLQCFKEAEEALDFISERLIVPSESNQNDSINQESCLYSMCYMNYHSKKNIPLIDQQLELRVEQSMTENNQNENQQSSIFYESSIKSKYNQFENESHESAIKSQPDFSSSKKNMF